MFFALCTDSVAFSKTQLSAIWCFILPTTANGTQQCTTSFGCSKSKCASGFALSHLAAVKVSVPVVSFTEALIESVPD
jgi:hypothetical protein